MTGEIGERVVRLEVKQDFVEKKLDVLITKIDSLASCIKREITQNSKEFEQIINRRIEPIKKDLEALKFLIPIAKYPKAALILLVGALALLGINIVDIVKETII